MRPGIAATSTDLRILKQPGDIRGRRVCLFVSYAPDRTLKPHVLFHLKALRAAGLDIIYVLVADELGDRLPQYPKDLFRGFVIRKNAGFDFGAWADAFRSIPALWSAAAVVLVNDSVFGPVRGTFGDLIGTTLSQPADFVGLTESVQVARHFQSYFLVLKGRALSSPRSREFWFSVRNHASKKGVIIDYEISLLRRYEQLGFRCAPMLSWRHVPGESRINPTHMRWRELLRHGFPYIKVELLRDNPVGINIDGWRDEIQSPELLAAIDVHLGKAGAAKSPPRRLPGASSPPPATRGPE